MRCYGIAGLVIAMALGLSPALSQTLTPDTSSSNTRPSPLMEFSGVKCGFLNVMSTCARSEWLSLLAEDKLDELRAPAGGRAYRLIWAHAFTKEGGFVEVVIDGVGAAKLRTSWSQQWIGFEPAQLSAFEAELASSGIPTDLIQSHGASCLDECNDFVLEEVVGGAYRYGEQNGGFSDRDVRDAVDHLDKLARYLTHQH